MKQVNKILHRYVGLFVSIVLLFFSVSGIILNHRSVFSSVDVSRDLLPNDYKYKNWNNASVRGSVRLDSNKILLYGNIGIWQTDTLFSKVSDFNMGFPKGIDSKKTSKIIQSPKGVLAATLFGLYVFDNSIHKWRKIILPVNEENVVDLLMVNEKILILTRSNLLETNDLIKFSIIKLPCSTDYDNKIGFFKTLWVIHSGEVYGFIGRILVDLVGGVCLFLSIGGIIIFTSRRVMKRYKNNISILNNAKKMVVFNLHWHNKIGIIFAILLLVTTVTGMFLRPPLLIPIVNCKVYKIPFSELDTPNPWFDKLRRIIYMSEYSEYIISTSDGFYKFDKDFKTKAKALELQPPVSVMGVTVLENVGKDCILVGSFQGLYSWNVKSGYVFDIMKNEPYLFANKSGSPVGEFKISGFTHDFKNLPVALDYQLGAIDLISNKNFQSMPKELILCAPISLWNLALEIHTGRIFSSLIGMFYLLYIPLGGLLILVTIITGVILWFKVRQSSR